MKTRYKTKPSNLFELQNRAKKPVVLFKVRCSNHLHQIALVGKKLVLLNHPYNSKEEGLLRILAGENADNRCFKLLKDWQNVCRSNTKNIESITKLFPKPLIEFKSKCKQSKTAINVCSEECVHYSNGKSFKKGDKYIQFRVEAPIKTDVKTVDNRLTALLNKISKQFYSNVMLNRLFKGVIPKLYANNYDDKLKAHRRIQLNFYNDSFSIEIDPYSFYFIGIKNNITTLGSNFILLNAKKLSANSFLGVYLDIYTKDWAAKIKVIHINIIDNISYYQELYSC